MNYLPRVYRLCESPNLRVIPRSPPLLLADDEESRTVLKILTARFLAPTVRCELHSHENHVIRAKAEFQMPPRAGLTKA
jgi:hypothetical protein